MQKSLQEPHSIQLTAGQGEGRQAAALTSSLHPWPGPSKPPARLPRCCAPLAPSGSKAHPLAPAHPGYEWGPAQSCRGVGGSRTLRLQTPPKAEGPGRAWALLLCLSFGQRGSNLSITVSPRWGCDMPSACCWTGQRPRLRGSCTGKPHTMSPSPPGWAGAGRHSCRLQPRALASLCHFGLPPHGPLQALDHSPCLPAFGNKLLPSEFYTFWGSSPLGSGLAHRQGWGRPTSNLMSGLAPAAYQAWWSPFPQSGHCRR